VLGKKLIEVFLQFFWVVENTQPWKILYATVAVEKPISTASRIMGNSAIGVPIALVQSRHSMRIMAQDTIT